MLHLEHSPTSTVIPERSEARSPKLSSSGSNGSKVSEKQQAAAMLAPDALAELHAAKQNVVHAQDWLYAVSEQPGSRRPIARTSHSRSSFAPYPMEHDEHDVITTPLKSVGPMKFLGNEFEPLPDTAQFLERQASKQAAVTTPAAVRADAASAVQSARAKFAQADASLKFLTAHMHTSDVEALLGVGTEASTHAVKMRRMHADEPAAATKPDAASTTSSTQRAVAYDKLFHQVLADRVKNIVMNGDLKRAVAHAHAENKLVKYQMQLSKSKSALRHATSGTSLESFSMGGSQAHDSLSDFGTRRNFSEQSLHGSSVSGASPRSDLS